MRCSSEKSEFSRGTILARWRFRSRFSDRLLSCIRWYSESSFRKPDSLGVVFPVRSSESTLKRTGGATADFSKVVVLLGDFETSEGATGSSISAFFVSDDIQPSYVAFRLNGKPKNPLTSRQYRVCPRQGAFRPILQACRSAWSNHKSSLPLSRALPDGRSGRSTRATSPWNTFSES
jgi:hypothetical protein